MQHTALVISIIQHALEELESARDHALLDAQVTEGLCKAEAENAAQMACQAHDSLLGEFAPTAVRIETHQVTVMEVI